jgi:hypothetical protein
LFILSTGLFTQSLSNLLKRRRGCKVIKGIRERVERERERERERREREEREEEESRYDVVVW